MKTPRYIISGMPFFLYAWSDNAALRSARNAGFKRGVLRREYDYAEASLEESSPVVMAR